MATATRDATARRALLALARWAKAEARRGLRVHHGGTGRSEQDWLRVGARALGLALAAREAERRADGVR